MRIGHHSIVLKVFTFLPSDKEILPRKKRLALRRQIAASTTHTFHKYLPIMSEKELREKQNRHQL